MKRFVLTAAIIVAGCGDGKVATSPGSAVTTCNPGNGNECGEGRLCNPCSMRCEPEPSVKAVSCGAECVDKNSDPKNCSVCGTTCTGQNPVCSEGHCASACNSGFTNCSNACVVLETSVFNCGACGVHCSVSEVCLGAKCQCPAGFTMCGSACVDLMNDPENCNTCGTLCGGESPFCNQGRCANMPGNGSGDGGAPRDSGTIAQTAEDAFTAVPGDLSVAAVPADISAGAFAIGVKASARSILCYPRDAGHIRIGGASTVSAGQVVYFTGENLAYVGDCRLEDGGAFATSGDFQCNTSRNPDVFTTPVNLGYNPECPAS